MRYKKSSNDKIFGIDKCHEYLVETYKKLDSFCKSIGIKPFLLWGTLLGAKRKGKIIPWDDDVDLGLIESDFKILIENRNSLEKFGLGYIFYKDNKKAYSHELRVFQLGYYKVSDGNFASYLTPICIDIFPAYKISLSMDNRVKANIEKKLKKNLSLLIEKSSIWKSKSKAKAFLKGVKKFFLFFVPFNRLHKNVEETLARLNSGGVYGYCFPETLHNVNRHLDVFDSEQFEDLETLDFEGIKSFVPGKTDKFLDFVYGDWHTEKDRSHGKVFDEIFLFRK